MDVRWRDNYAKYKSVQCSCSVVSDSATPWIRQASLSITNSQSSLKLLSIESVMPSNYLILCHPLLLPLSIFPSIRVSSSELFASGDQRIGASASASVLPMNIQDWFPLGLIGLIILLIVVDKFSKILVFPSKLRVYHWLINTVSSLPWRSSLSPAFWRWHLPLCPI